MRALAYRCILITAAVTGWQCFEPVAECVPTTCEEIGAQCGTAPDRCGGTLECGTCGGAGGCQSNRCVCPSETDAAFCARLAKNCGQVAGLDTCGLQRTIDCGRCTAPDVCGGSGEANVCGCAPEADEAICARLGACCTTVTAADNCGGNRVVHCSACEHKADAGTTCQEGFWPTSDGGCSAWIAAQPLAEPRFAHVAMPLDDGRVLVAGGAKNGSLNESLQSVELFDACFGWSPGPSMVGKRAFPTIHHLDDGTFLVIAGDDFGGPTAERWSPDAGSALFTGSVPGIGYWHASAQLGSGGVLAMGGYGPQGAARYDPVSGSWTEVGLMLERRYGHRAVLLRDGRVLVVGGADPIQEQRRLTTEIFDPATNGFSAAGALAQGHHFATLTLLPDGTVLVAGGTPTPQVATGGLERFDPASRTWRDAGTGLPRAGHTATLLPNGRVLLLGGGADLAEVYDPATGIIIPSGDLGDARMNHTATLLEDGTVLVVGGSLPDGGQAIEKIFGGAR